MSGSAVTIAGTDAATPASPAGEPVEGRWLFGKLPAHGDFIARGLDHAARDRLDQWLSTEMGHARDAHADFDERWVTAPACNFVDRDDDGRWSGGALCASVDRVGRRYPVILSAPATDAAGAAALSGGCLGALHEAFSQGWDADSLHLADLAPSATAWQPDSSEWVLLGEDGAAWTARGRFPEGIVKAMLDMAT